MPGAATSRRPRISIVSPWTRGTHHGTPPKLDAGGETTAVLTLSSYECAAQRLLTFSTSSMSLLLNDCSSYRSSRICCSGPAHFSTPLLHPFWTALALAPPKGERDN